MSTPVKPMHITDAVLGSVGRVIPPSETLSHLVRLLGSASGLDRTFTLLEYTARLVAPALEWRARASGAGGSPAAASLVKLASKISEGLMLRRLVGLPPTFQWASSVERKGDMPPVIRTIERVQALSMVVYYALEHAYFLAQHKIMRLPRSLPFTAQKKPWNVKSMITKLSLWSTRAWAVYVVLQLFRLKVDWDLLCTQRRKARREMDKSDTETLKRDFVALEKRKGEIWNEFAINLAYLPLTAHWSLESGLFKSQTWTNLLGMAAAVYSFKASWKATAEA